jgi:hypothetical protein
MILGSTNIKIKTKINADLSRNHLNSSWCETARKERKEDEGQREEIDDRRVTIVE